MVGTRHPSPTRLRRTNSGSALGASTSVGVPFAVPSTMTTPPTWATDLVAQVGRNHARPAGAAA
jgi:hypothetical protein